MRADDLTAGILVFIAFVAMAPAWTYYLGDFIPARSEHLVIALLVLPAVVTLFITSWIAPELASLATGASLLICMIVLAPWWWQMLHMISSALVDHPLAQLMIQLSIPLLIMSFVIALGRRRLSAA